MEEKGLNGEAVKNIGSYVTLRGHPLELLSKLKNDGSKLLENIASANALRDLEKLFNALEEAKCLDKVVLDFSLARGLDYYTGVIYEAVLKGDMQVNKLSFMIFLAVYITGLASNYARIDFNTVVKSS